MTDRPLHPDTDEFVRTVANYYPSHKFSLKKASAMLEGVFKWSKPSDLFEMIGHFSGARPDDKAPPWDDIGQRLRTIGQMGDSAAAKAAKMRKDDAEWEDKRAAMIAEINWIPQERWAEVCELASSLNIPPGRPVPPDWDKKGLWVPAILTAWGRLRGSEVKDWALK